MYGCLCNPGQVVVRAVVRALVSSRDQAHQSQRLHEVLFLLKQVSLICWLLIKALPANCKKKLPAKAKKTVMVFARTAWW